MDVAAPRIVTEEDYLQAERRSLTKNEWRRGRIVAMSGGSPRHNLIVGNILAALKSALRGRRCLVLPSDQRVHVVATGTYTYPDVTVTCDKPRFHTLDKDSLTNPKVIVEVLSKSTEAYDRGSKFADYQSIPSFQEYVIVSQIDRRVEHFRRMDTGQWVLTISEGDGVLSLPVLACEVRLEEIYADLDLLDESAESPAPPSAVNVV